MADMPVATICSLALCAVIALAAGAFAPYPRARTEPWFDRYAKDTKAELRKISPAAELQMWITDDPFDQVADFYKRSGTEQGGFAQSIAASQSARIGRTVRMTHVMFDGASGPVASIDYVSIQRPVVVSFEPLEVHDVTMIGWYRSKK